MRIPSEPDRAQAGALRGRDGDEDGEVDDRAMAGAGGGVRCPLSAILPMNPERWPGLLTVRQFRHSALRPIFHEQSFS
jgi:hypothetical protein